MSRHIRENFMTKLNNRIPLSGHKTTHLGQQCCKALNYVRHGFMGTSQKYIYWFHFIVSVFKITHTRTHTNIHGRAHDHSFFSSARKGVVSQIRTIINVIVLNAFVCFSHLLLVFLHVILAVHSFSTSIELFHTLLLSTTLESLDNIDWRWTKKKNKIVVWLWLQTLLLFIFIFCFCFRSLMSFCFHGDLFTVCCFIHFYHLHSCHYFICDFEVRTL